MNQIKYEKNAVGSYILKLDGQYIGDVHKNKETGEWMAFSSIQTVINHGADVQTRAHTRKEAVRQLLVAIEEKKANKEAHVKSVKMDDEVVKADQARMLAAEQFGERKEAEKEFLLHLDLQHFSSSNWKDLVRVAVGSGISPGDIIKTAERGRRMKEKIASNVQRALYDIRDSGECYIKEPDIKDLLIKELDEMGIVHTVYNMNYVDDGLVYYIVQGEF